jgi:hypothetical protein
MSLAVKLHEDFVDFVNYWGRQDAFDITIAQIESIIERDGIADNSEGRPAVGICVVCI